MTDEIDTAAIRASMDDGGVGLHRLATVGGVKVVETLLALCDALDAARRALVLSEDNNIDLRNALDAARAELGNWEQRWKASDRYAQSVEQERDEALSLVLAATYTEDGTILVLSNLRAAKAAIERVRALCERNFNLEDHYEIDANDVIAILDGETP